jgi:hypothetical protein
MRIQLTRRLGQNKAGTVLDLTAPEVDVLVRGSHGIRLEDLKPGDDTPPSDEQDSGQDDDTDSLSTLKLADLKARAEQLDLPTYGTKAQLLERIEQAEQAKADHDDDPED